MEVTHEDLAGAHDEASSALPQAAAPHPGAASHAGTKPRAVPLEVAIALQAAAILLDYPAGDETDLMLITETLSELPHGEVRDRLARFMDWWKALTPRDREVAYVEAFELGADATLYLTGKRSREKHHRGQELLRFQDTYRDHGWLPCTAELPDYLPMVLEFAAAVPAGIDLLSGEREALVGLRKTLETGAGPFADVVAAVLAVIRGRTRGFHDRRAGGRCSAGRSTAGRRSNQRGPR